MHEVARVFHILNAMHKQFTLDTFRGIWLWRGPSLMPGKRTGQPSLKAPVPLAEEFMEGRKEAEKGISPCLIRL